MYRNHITDIGLERFSNSQQLMTCLEQRDFDMNSFSSDHFISDLYMLRKAKLSSYARIHRLIDLETKQVENLKIPKFW